jgi:hypothetical protein
VAFLRGEISEDQAPRLRHGLLVGSGWQTKEEQEIRRRIWK